MSSTSESLSVRIAALKAEIELLEKQVRAQLAAVPAVAAPAVACNV